MNKITYLFTEYRDVLVKGLGGADVAPRYAGVAGGARRQLALLEDQRQEGKEGMSETQKKRRVKNIPWLDMAFTAYIFKNFNFCHICFEVKRTYLSVVS